MREESGRHSGRYQGLGPLAALLLLAGCGSSAGSNSPQPDFSLVLGAPDPIQSGDAGTLAVSVQRSNGHTAAITLSLAANAQGITGGGSIPGGSSVGSVSLTVPSSVALATHALDLDGTDGSATRSGAFDLSVVARLAIQGASSLAIGSLGTAYALGFHATGGTSPHTWDVVAGALPPGLALDASGMLGGTPTSSGSFAFTLRVTDAFGASVTRALTHSINGGLLAGLGSNGSFEQGFTGWSPLGASVGALYTLVADAVDGASAARVTNGSQLFHAPAQGVFSSLLASAGDTPVTTRFWIKLDAPAMARCTLNLTSDLGGGLSSTVKLILAERVVRSANTWVEVEGTTTLAWSGTLTSATLGFDIGQPAEGVFPGFTLDHLRVERDADADSLSDADESAAQANDPDRDGDGLPDGWESLHATPGALDPDLADAELDADLDGYSNHEEYWAATDPLDSLSMPGVPCVAGASAGVLAITAGLALLPSKPSLRVVSGQHITGQTSLGGLAGEFTANVQALFEQTGKWPGILSMQYEGGDAGIGPLQVDLVNPQAESWAASGGLVLIKFNPFDPWTLAASSAAGGAHVDLPGLLDPALGDPANLAANTTANARWLDWLNQMATGLDELQQAGVTVLWRPLSEMNNGSHWHSRQPRDPWIALWRDMHAYFSTTRGLKNLIWVFESDAVAHTVVPADYYYPGDDVVDLMGHNFYDDDWVFPYDLEAIFRRYPKIYGFPQAGSSSVRDGTWDNRTMILGIQQGYARASLFCTWNDFYTGGGTFTTRSMVSQSFASELLSDPWIVTREELGW